MGIVELKNDKIAIKVNTHGAELVSLKSIETDREYMWCGDAEYWGRVSPVLFPFVGKLEGQRYRHNGVVYENIPQHGFARDSEFVVARLVIHCCLCLRRMIHGRRAIRLISVFV